MSSTHARKLHRSTTSLAIAASTMLLTFGLAAPSHAASEQGQARGQDKTSQSSQDSDNRGQSNASSHKTQGNASTQGDPTKPQPESTADDNETGANADGPYDSTRDGSESQNGKGDGKATGKPGAGMVGRADNKNPGASSDGKGQYPNGSDNNAGYECDRNQGIGQGNPAHTGCTQGSTPPPECVDNPDTPGDDCGQSPPPCVDNPDTPGDDCGQSPPPCVDNPDTPGNDCGQSPPPCVDNPDTPGDDCGQSPPPCVDNPDTPGDDCGQSPPPCVDNPDMPGNDCGQSPPECVDNPNTPMDECDTTTVLPPEGGPRPPVTVLPPTGTPPVVTPPTGTPPAGTPPTALPNTGSSAFDGLLAGLGAALVASGLFAVRRRKVTI